MGDFVEKPFLSDGGDAPFASGSDSRETKTVTVDDAYSAQVEFANGTIGVIEGLRFVTVPNTRNTIALTGSDGSIHFDLEWFNELGYSTVTIGDSKSTTLPTRRSRT
ncbi:hypothetical protein [Halohasta litorea]|uniref:hypothetical protein n=1 Tax=Halohasta litorea TaxID=869891 RepID=UPI0021133615|nr:hypothetical protein [Halohasta litorea]